MDQCFCSPGRSRRGSAREGAANAGHPGSTTGRDINPRYQRARIEEADERDYAAARSGEHECICTTALRAHCTSDRARSCSPATL